ncbi:hypothetical protein F4821DRAFT_135361 [Hypoxylon rubiginosum]|uniref:Uncharacterized protein n=1 Tax=Hypoxylon rubiginosum TaxID=110542 RepID=A0ACC0DI78_9PEZI|nr:hypothetical protein F4821DRAFT_135361 [Hypoxylon rubiginosum]
MMNDRLHDSTTSNMLALSAHGAHMQHGLEDEAAAEVDEPPDDRRAHLTNSQFKKNAIRKAAEHSESLLTKALHHSEDDSIQLHFGLSSRNRSMNDNISLASTADLTSDTGFTSPARTNTPSPPPPVISLSRLNTDLFDEKSALLSLHDTEQITPVAKFRREPIGNKDVPKDPAVEALTKKRCISFACGPKPDTRKPTAPQQSAQPKPVVEEKPQKKPCIKFACPAKPAHRTPPKNSAQQPVIPSATGLKGRDKSPAVPRKLRSPSINRGRTQRSLTPRPSTQSPIATRCAKYLTVNPSDLNSECSRFHEFASDEPQEEDWIRLNQPAPGRRLTINDTLKKENEIRRLAKEAEEEELEEEEEDEEAEQFDDEEDDDLDEDDDEDEDELDKPHYDFKVDAEDNGYDDVDSQSGYGSGDDFSDGYNTDNEIGFADSDDDDDGGNLDLWTPSRGPTRRLSENTPIYRRPSMTGNRSDSSSSSDMANAPSRMMRERSRRIKMRPGTPELPDSTDFVCGTLDEDRALEDAYVSCMAARRREKLHLIPQDIDPSFPTSEPEDEDIEPHKSIHGSDDHLSEDEREKRNGDRYKKRADQTPPKRYHSPPPKRHHSPPKPRGRSPRRLFDRHSPRRLVSPAPGPVVRSPPSSLVQPAGPADHDFKSLAFRPGLTHTKSLPRAPAMFPQHLKNHRRHGKPSSTTSHRHVRGAIDIVKGLEQKRQRRKEKFKEKYFQKHCHLARKGQIQEKRPQPGQGAERMREIGLLMAGKLGPDQFVLSI